MLSADVDPKLEALLRRCLESGASDLHLGPGLQPAFRRDGQLVREGQVLDAVLLESIARGLVGEAHIDEFERAGSRDGALTACGGTRFRYNVYRTLNGVSMAFRRLEERHRSLAELGIPESLYEVCQMKDGLVAICGPTGAGKSTTLAALVDHINQTRDAHIVTIEDPIEYIHRSARSLVNQREVGLHVPTFNDALVASLREDPDVILLGELRDLDTMRTALRAAETGHLVLTTVHAADCIGALERLVSVFPAEEQLGIRRQLGLTVRMFVTQALVSSDGPRRSGDRARVAVSEIMKMTPAIAHMLAHGRMRHILGALETGSREGMQTFDQDLRRLLSLGLISKATALALARSPEDLKVVSERSGERR